MIVLLFATSGVAIAKVRTEAVRSPILSPERSQYRLKAYVVDIVSSSREEPRLLLAPIRIEGLSAAETPVRVRVALRPGALEGVQLAPGDAISAFAILNPPPSPAVPGGYDFARTAWFDGIGGVGLIPGRISPAKATPISARLQRLLWINRLRWQVTQRLVTGFNDRFKDESRTGGFAAALVTGHQAYAHQSLIEAMRASGLAHILSISGVHMAIVGGFAYVLSRALMALWPRLALSAPIRKIAAVLASGCILAYLALSGAPPPAQRAAIVALVAFGAILLDRQALSLRSLAIAALIVIALQPEAVLQPGFQMSFCATAALLALAEAWPRRVSEIRVPVWIKALQSTGNAVWVSLVASLVATAATTPVSVAFFNRVAVYGLMANLVEAPVSSLVVMPSLMLGTLLSATPLAGVFDQVGGWGLQLIDLTARFTADLPGAVQTLPGPPSGVLVASLMGVMVVCLVRGRLRWLGVLPAVAVLVWPRPAAPDIWIDPVAGNAAVRVGTDSIVLRARVRQYGYEMWSQKYGLNAADLATRDRYFDCKGYGCLPKPSSDISAAFWFSNKPPKPEWLLAACMRTRLVVVRAAYVDFPAPCAQTSRITGKDAARLGAMELTRTQTGWDIRAAEPLRGNRFWTQPSQAEAEAQ